MNSSPKRILSFSKEVRWHIYVTEMTRKSLLSCQFFCETRVDGSSALRPGVLGCVAGRRGGSFFLSPVAGGEGRQEQINGDKWSWEWDGPEAKDINNAGRH